MPVSETLLVTETIGLIVFLTQKCKLVRIQRQGPIIPFVIKRRTLGDLSRIVGGWYGSQQVES